MDHILYLKDPSSGQVLEVHNFGMGLSAVVSGNETQGIELTQKIANFETEPILSPGIVVMGPKQSELPSDWEITPTEHRFEMLQFNRATATEGSTHRSQEYYNLLIELWADVGDGIEGQRLIRVAWAASTRLIVLGPSPNQYERKHDGTEWALDNEQVGRVERSWHGMSTENDNKGKMSISLPKIGESAGLRARRLPEGTRLIYG